MDFYVIVDGFKECLKKKVDFYTIDGELQNATKECQIYWDGILSMTEVGTFSWGRLNKNKRN